jgi:hypothetical protein
MTPTDIAKTAERGGVTREIYGAADGAFGIKLSSVAASSGL